METIKLIINDPPRVKKNTQRAIVTKNRKTGKFYPRIVQTEAYRLWHKSAVKQIKLQKPSFEINYPINLKCEFYMPTKGLVDLSALYEGIQDTLVELNVLSDDNYSIVASHDGSGVYVDKKNPRMEITITPKKPAITISNITPPKKEVRIIPVPVNKEVF